MDKALRSHRAKYGPLLQLRQIIKVHRNEVCAIDTSPYHLEMLRPIIKIRPFETFWAISSLVMIRFSTPWKLRKSSIASTYHFLSTRGTRSCIHGHIMGVLVTLFIGHD